MDSLSERELYDADARDNRDLVLCLLVGIAVGAIGIIVLEAVAFGIYWFGSGLLDMLTWALDTGMIWS